MTKNLQDELNAIEQQIREAFRGVTRDGGVSWSQAEVIDFYGTEEEETASRLKDRDKSWEDLVEDPAWDEDPGVGGFTFLDAISWRYDIAPAMIRCARRGNGFGVGFALEHSSPEDIAAVNVRQAAIIRFLRFMVAIDPGNEAWYKAYESNWRRYERTP